MIETEAPPLCNCHRVQMIRNGSNPKTGTTFWRCSVKSRASNAEWRAAHRPPVERVEYAESASIRYSKRTHDFNRHARARAGEYAARAERYGTDGSAIIPLRYLWYPTIDVGALLDRAFGSDLDATLIAAGVSETWSHVKAREHVSFDKADKLLTRLGLYTWQLADPLFSVGPPSNPQRRSVAA